MRSDHVLGKDTTLRLSDVPYRIFIFVDAFASFSHHFGILCNESHMWFSMVSDCLRRGGAISCPRYLI